MRLLNGVLILQGEIEIEKLVVPLCAFVVETSLFFLVYLVDSSRFLRPFHAVFFFFRRLPISKSSLSEVGRIGRSIIILHLSKL